MSMGFVTKGILGKIMGDITTIYKIKYPLNVTLQNKKKQITLLPIRKTISLNIKEERGGGVMITNIYVGDSIEFEANAGEDISGWKIRCEIYDNKKHSIKKATTNSGGNDNQIKITKPSLGQFSIYINAGETANFDTINNTNIEIEVELPNGKLYTIKKDKIKFESSQIQWKTP